MESLKTKMYKKELRQPVDRGMQRTVLLVAGLPKNADIAL